MVFLFRQQAAWSPSSEEINPRARCTSKPETQALKCHLQQEMLVCKPVNSTPACLQTGQSAIRAQTRLSSALEQAG